MTNQSERELLIRLVTKIVNCDGSEEEIDSWLDQAQGLVVHPSLSDLIFYPEKDDVTPEEIVDEALSYKPMSLG